VRDLGATYHSAPVGEVAEKLRPDILIEATGVPAVVVECLNATGAYGITCLTGVSPTGRRIEFDAGAMNRSIVLENDVVIGSVNANPRHYAAAASALAAADQDWLSGMITRRVPLSRWRDAYGESSGDVKVVLDLTA
jgi:threonine dehydrogenase-like Zn-dependent dehydrogenase